MAHMTESEAYKAGLIPKPKRNKFNSKKAECSNADHLHDSIGEANYCSNLKLRLKNDEFCFFKTQVSFEVQPAFISFSGKKIRSINYVADFVIEHHNGIVEIVDVKGLELAVFKIKWKLLQYSLRDSRKADYIFTIAK